MNYYEDINIIISILDIKIILLLDIKIIILLAINIIRELIIRRAHGLKNMKFR